MLFAVPEPKKLTFMYLANDVIQNSKKKGPEYGKEFSNVLPKVFSHIGETCKSEKLLGSLGRILNIWKERGVYDSKTIADYRTRLNHEATSSASHTPTGNGSKGSGGSETKHSSSSSSSKTEKLEKREKRKHEERHSKAKRSRSSHHASASAAAAEAEQPAGEAENGHTPPYLPLGEPPEPEELIKALTSIENSASSDALVRERIAKLPPEISEISCITKLEDKDKAKVLAKQVRLPFLSSTYCSSI